MGNATSGLSATAASSGSRSGSSSQDDGVTPPAGSRGASLPLKVGVAVPDTAAIAAAFGKTASDPYVAPKGLIAQINREGGVAGRQIKAVYAKADSAGDASNNAQQVCSAFTEDNKVDVVVSTLGSDLLASCLAKRGVATIDTIQFAGDAETLRSLPGWLIPQAMRIDRYAGALLATGSERGVLKRGGTLGVLIEDCPYAPRVMKNVIEPRAAELGLKVVQGTYRCVTNLVGDIAPVTQDVQRETLRFASAGVTDVTVLGGTEAFAFSRFTQNASSQGYFPRYLVTTNSNVYSNSQSDAVIKISPDALPHVLGVGIAPRLDTGPAGTPSSPAQASARARCVRADKTMGTATSEEGSGRYFKENAFYNFCDAFYVLKAAIETQGGRSTLADVVAGYRTALGGGLVSAALAGGAFGVTGQRTDGVGLVRPMKYDDTKKGFVYVGPATRVP